MSVTKQWAKNWDTFQAPRRHGDRDGFFAQFTDNEGNSVRVEITAQDLKDFGEAPEDLRAKAKHTEDVLRAVLETYESRLGKPPAVIDAKDLSNHGLQKIKEAIAKGYAQTPDRHKG